MKVGELKRLIDAHGFQDDDEVVVRIIVRPMQLDEGAMEHGEIVVTEGPTIAMCPVDEEDVLDAMFPGALVLMVGLEDGASSFDPKRGL